METGDPHAEVLILGIGNLLWADEGFGVRCVEALAARWQLPPTVRVLDGGTQGLYLLPHVQSAKRLIVFDAVDYGLAPGTVRVVADDDVPRFLGAKKMSLHQTGFQEVLASAALIGAMPERLMLFGVQPEELEDFGGSLRPCVRARVAEAVEWVIDLLVDWGHSPTLRDAPQEDGSPLSLRAYESGRPSAEAACRVGDARVLRAWGVSC